MNLCNAREYMCDECGAEDRPTVVMMESAGDGSRWFCAGCLRMAIVLLEGDARPRPWHPIETAPFERRVLVGHPNGGHLTMIAVRSDRGWFSDEDSDTKLGWEPTHWKPIDACPAKEASALEAEPVARVNVFQDQIDADRACTRWALREVDRDPSGPVDRKVERLRGDGYVTSLWSARSGRAGLDALAVVLRDDFNRSLLVTVSCTHGGAGPHEIVVAREEAP